MIVKVQDSLSLRLNCSGQLWLSCCHGNCSGHLLLSMSQVELLWSVQAFLLPVAMTIAVAIYFCFGQSILLSIELLWSALSFLLP